MNLDKLISIFNTLCRIQVSGYQNVSMMAGSLQTLREVVEDMQTESINQEITEE